MLWITPSCSSIEIRSRSSRIASVATCRWSRSFWTAIAARLARFSSRAASSLSHSRAPAEDALAGYRPEVFDGRSVGQRVRGQNEAQRVLGAARQRAGQGERFVIPADERGLDRDQLRPAGGQRAGLVAEQLADAAEALEHGRVADQDAA